MLIKRKDIISLLGIGQYSVKLKATIQQTGRLGFDRYGGYGSWNKWILFYDFAVQGYDLHFRYKGREFHFVTGKDHVALCDNHCTKECQCFPDANMMIEQFEIDGKKLIDVIEELEDVEPV